MDTDKSLKKIPSHSYITLCFYNYEMKERDSELTLSFYLYNLSLVDFYTAQSFNEFWILWTQFIFHLYEILDVIGWIVQNSM